MLGNQPSQHSTQGESCIWRQHGQDRRSTEGRMLLVPPHPRLWCQGTSSISVTLLQSPAPSPASPSPAGKSILLQHQSRPQKRGWGRSGALREALTRSQAESSCRGYSKGSPPRTGISAPAGSGGEKKKTTFPCAPPLSKLSGGGGEGAPSYSLLPSTHSDGSCFGLQPPASLPPAPAPSSPAKLLASSATPGQPCPAPLPFAVQGGEGVAVPPSPPCIPKPWVATAPA